MFLYQSSSARIFVVLHPKGAITVSIHFAANLVSHDMRNG